MIVDLVELEFDRGNGRRRVGGVNSWHVLSLATASSNAALERELTFLRQVKHSGAGEMLDDLIDRRTLDEQKIAPSGGRRFFA